MGITIKYLRRTTSAAAGNGLGITIKYLANQNAGAGSNWAKAYYTGACTNLTESFCCVAAFVANSEPPPPTPPPSPTAACPSVRACAGPELARCVHYSCKCHYLTLAYISRNLTQKRLFGGAARNATKKGIVLGRPGVRFAASKKKMA
jgi:hypothetical protein